MIREIIRVLITLCAAVFLIWFIAPMFFGIKNIGNIAGIVISICFIFRFGFENFYFRIKNICAGHTFTKILLRIAQISASAFVAYAVIVSGFMVFAMLSKPAENATAVVLGAEVKPWGPSVLLRQRINAAEKYMTENPGTDAVVTGGKGENEVMSEGQCMFEEMVKDGIKPDRIYIENQASNTNQNMRFSMKIITENKLNRNIAVVSDSYHQLRARIIAKKISPESKVGAINTNNNYIGISAYPAYFVREWIAVPAEIIKQLFSY